MGEEEEVDLNNTINKSSATKKMQNLAPIRKHSVGAPIEHRPHWEQVWRTPLYRFYL